MIKPDVYFTALKNNGFKVRLATDVKPVTRGTVERRILYRYTAAKNTNGHIVSIEGDVHTIGPETHISANIILTTEIRALAQLPPDKPVNINSIDRMDLLKLIGYGVIAEDIKSRS